MDNTKTITHLSLCSGYEGLGIGLRRVLPNLREIAYVEIEAFAIQNLVEKMEKGLLDAAPIFTDLKTFPYRKFRGKISLMLAGFPCQPFSSAGKRKATEDPRHLFPYIERGIEECIPDAVIFENVEGIISAKTTDGESVLKYVIRRLEDLGYTTEAGVFSASEVGAPHQRKRVFIMGYSKNWRSRRIVADCGETRENIQSICSDRQDSKSKELGNTEGARQQSCDERQGEEQLGRASAWDTQLSDTENFGRRGRSHRNDSRGWSIQEQASQEQPNLRSKVEGCGGNNGGEELGHTNSQRCEGERLRRDEGESEGVVSEWSSEEGRELGNATRKCNGLNQTQRQGGNTSSRSSEERTELADSCDEGLQGSELNQTLPREAKAQWSTPQCSNAERSEERQELADSEGKGLEGYAGVRSKQDRGCELTPQNQWPARPNNPQYEWEEPRVVFDSQNISTTKDCESEGSLKPKLGRTVDGPPRRLDANRVDRLRLLGNGIVPATAEKAFRILNHRLQSRI